MCVHIDTKTQAIAQIVYFGATLDENPCSARGAAIKCAFN